MVLAAIFLLAIMACSGGGGSTTTPPPESTVFNLGKFTDLTTGTSYTLDFTGSDTTGASYTGTQQITVVGPTTFEGKSVIQKDGILVLTKVGVGVIINSIIQTYYYHDRTLYKIVYSSGVTATPSNTFPLPTTVEIGNIDEGQSLAYSNGNSTTETWQVTDAGYNIAYIVFTSTSNLEVSEIDTITINTEGTISGITEVIYNFPSTGVTTTLHGTVQ